MRQVNITVIIPVKNEEKNLPRCLNMLEQFNQVMVIDSGSTDRTPDIVKEFGAEYYLFEWDGQFPKKRNWALRNLDIKNDWVLYLDADEIISEAFIREIEKKTKNDAVNGFWLIYKNYFMGKKLNYGDVFTKLALFRLGTGEYEYIDEHSWSFLDMEVHEHPIVKGKIGKIKSPIDHNDFRGLEQYISRHNDYSTWEANRFMALTKEDFKHFTRRQRIKYNLMRIGCLPSFYFFGAYFLRLGILDGSVGFYLARYKANYFLQIQTKIIELKRLKKMP